MLREPPFSSVSMSRESAALAAIGDVPPIISPHEKNPHLRAVCQPQAIGNVLFFFFFFFFFLCASFSVLLEAGIQREGEGSFHEGR